MSTVIDMHAGMRCLTDNQKELLECSLYDLGLGERTVNRLEKYGVLTVGQLLQCRAHEIRSLSNIGQKTLETIYARLKLHGFECPQYRN